MLSVSPVIATGHPERHRTRGVDADPADTVTLRVKAAPGPGGQIRFR